MTSFDKKVYVVREIDVAISYPCGTTYYGPKLRKVFNKEVEAISHKLMLMESENKPAHKFEIIYADIDHCWDLLLNEYSEENIPAGRVVC